MDKKTSKIIASTAAVCLVLSSTPVLAAENNKTDSIKLSGSDRIHTAIKIAEQGFKGDFKSSKTVVLAPQADKNLVDALAVSPLAYKLNAPILLSGKDEIDSDTLKVMKDNKVTKVYIATGEGVISTKVEKQLKEIGAEVIRLGGKDRFETASNILKEFEKNKGNAENIALVSGTGLADALSISSIAAAKGMPIVLTNGKDKIASNFENVLNNAKEVYAVGGNGVISDKLVNQIKAIRLGGNDRYETNTKVIESFAKNDLKFDKIYLANGENKHLVDSLTGSILAAQTNSPIVLGQDAKLSGVKALENNITKDSNFIELGGQVNDDFVKSAENVAPKVEEKPEEKPTVEKPTTEKPEEKPTVEKPTTEKPVEKPSVENIVLTISEPVENNLVDTNSKTFKIAGTVTEGSKVTYSIDDNDEKTKAITGDAIVENGNWSKDSIDLSSLKDGKLTVTIKATNKDKDETKETSQTVNIVKDSYRPYGVQIGNKATITFDGVKLYAKDNQELKNADLNDAFKCPEGLKINSASYKYQEKANESTIVLEFDKAPTNGDIIELNSNKLFDENKNALSLKLKYNAPKGNSLFGNWEVVE